LEVVPEELRTDDARAGLIVFAEFVNLVRGALTKK
jgi:hypothetical protein